MQVNRLFQIIYILTDKKKVTAKELAEYFEVSIRTIYRDLDNLSACGIPIYMSRGKGGGISILEGFILNKTVLTKEEKSDIITSLQAVNAIKVNETDTALKKLSSLFGSPNPNWIEIDLSTWNNSNKESETFNKIKSAIFRKNVIKFCYSGIKGEDTLREVEPIKLIFKGSSQYLYAYCKLREDFRFFKLSRIKDIIVLDIHFTEKPTKEIFYEEKSLKKEIITLKLKISSKMAFRVYDEFDNYSKNSDGSFIVSKNVPNNEWLISYIFSFGSNVEVLEPLELRNSIKKELENIINIYL